MQNIVQLDLHPPIQCSMLKLLMWGWWWTSEFEDTSYGIQDGQWIPGSSSLQGFRWTDYAVVPARGDFVKKISANISKKIHRKFLNFQIMKLSKRSTQDPQAQHRLATKMNQTLTGNYGEQKEEVVIFAWGKSWKGEWGSCHRRKWTWGIRVAGKYWFEWLGSQGNMDMLQWFWGRAPSYETAQGRWEKEEVVGNMIHKHQAWLHFSENRQLVVGNYEG